MNAPPGRRKAPGGESQGSSEVIAATSNHVTRSGPTIAGRVVVNARCARTWSFEDDHRVARLIQELEWAPAGADVTIIVSPRQFPPLAVDYLREHGSHIGSITVECSDPETVARWVRAFRDGVAASCGNF